MIHLLRTPRDGTEVEAARSDILQMQHRCGLGAYPVAQLSVAIKDFPWDGMTSWSSVFQPAASSSPSKHRSIARRMIQAAVDAPGEAPGSATRDLSAATTSSAKKCAAGLRTLRTDGPYAQNVYWSAT